MKNYLLLSLILLLTQFSCAQDTKVPAKIASAFKVKFPQIESPKWEKENDSSWEADYYVNGQKYSASFSQNGEWISTENEIKVSMLPQSVIDLMDNQFTDYDIDEVERVETPRGEAYEIEIEVGDEEFVVNIDAKGKLTKLKDDDDNKEEEEEEDDDGEEDDEEEDKDGDN